MRTTVAVDFIEQSPYTSLCATNVHVFHRVPPTALQGGWYHLHVTREESGLREVKSLSEYYGEVSSGDLSPGSWTRWTASGMSDIESGATISFPAEQGGSWLLSSEVVGIWQDRLRTEGEWAKNVFAKHICPGF